MARKKRIPKPSPELRKNPTKTGTIENSYAGALRALFRKYRNIAPDVLRSAKQLSAKELQFDYNLAQIVVELKNYTGGVILIPANEIIDRFSFRAFNAGTKFAQQQIPLAPQVGFFGPADWRAIDAIKVANLQGLEGITSDMNKQIIRELTDGMQRGINPNDMAKLIENRVDKVGIVRATTLARTEVNRAFNIAAETRYVQYGYDKLMWVAAVGSERTCALCEGLDGEVFDVKSDHSRPPLHPDCRCSVIPVD